jgi:hypothetical protein
MRLNTSYVCCLFLSTVNASLRASSYFLGAYNEFAVTISSEAQFNPTINITYKLPIGKNTIDQEIWSSIPNKPIIAVGSAVDNRPPILNGNYQVDTTLTMLSAMLQITIISQNAEYSDLIIEGTLNDGEENPVGNFTLTFSVPSWQQNPFSKYTSLEFSVATRLYDTAITNIHTIFSYGCYESESFFGFGEQFTYFNLTGRVVPILVSEQGVGRGLQPITNYLNSEISPGVGGDWYTSYAPKALYVTDFNRSLLLDTNDVSFFDLTQTVSKTVSIDIWTSSFTGKVMLAHNWLDLIECITLFTGRMKSLPLWTQQGAIVGLEGGTENVTKIVQSLLDGGVKIAGRTIELCAT